MRKPISDPQHLKNKILATIYIFRCLPVSYFWQIAKQEKELAKVQSQMNNLVSSGNLIEKPSISGQFFVYLTKKGYGFLTTQVLGNDKFTPFYQLNEAHSLRTGITDHQYMNFVFVWHWLGENHHLLSKEIKVYEDSNLNHCKIKFTFAGRDIILAPDILIYLPDEANKSIKKALFVENDTGAETHRKVYQKLVEYSALADKGLRQNIISQAALYFVFHSKKRLDTLFSDNGIFRLFSYYNNSDKVKGLTIDTFLNTFDGQIFPLYVSVFNENNKDNVYDFHPLNLKDRILQRRPEWKHLL